MPTIATLTMNPTIDVAYEVDRMEATHKLRSSAERYDPGGGGINVARVFVRLGGNATCHYLSGGATGVALDGLLDLHLLVRRPVRVAGATRICSNVHERSTGKEYRFVPRGSDIQEAEWLACLSSLGQAQCDYMVASGSLPPGVPDDFYARAARTAREAGHKFVLDTSGSALSAALDEGGIYLVKPNQAELEHLTGSSLSDISDIREAAMELVAKGQAEMVAVTLGDNGALLAMSDGARHLPAMPVEARSAVGAGDSFVAGMMYGLATGREPLNAFRFGMAAGSAAVLTAGTDLSRPEDIMRLYDQSGGDKG